MDALWGLVGSVIGVIGAIGFGVWSDKKGYNDIAKKVGVLDNTTLSGQHNEIKNIVSEKIECVDKNTKDLYSKVDGIAQVLNKNEGRYENLSLDQREVRNNVNKLVHSWENLIDDNRRLKGLVFKLEKENEILKHRITEKYKDHEDDWEMER